MSQAAQTTAKAAQKEELDAVRITLNKQDVTVAAEIAALQAALAAEQVCTVSCMHTFVYDSVYTELSAGVVNMCCSTVALASLRIRDQL